MWKIKCKIINVFLKITWSVNWSIFRDHQLFELYSKKWGILEMLKFHHNALGWANIKYLPRGSSRSSPSTLHTIWITFLWLTSALLEISHTLRFETKGTIRGIDAWWYKRRCLFTTEYLHLDEYWWISGKGFYFLMARCVDLWRFRLLF